ncbi:Ig-like domain-containing protein [Sporosarcina sp. FSL K6-5500]|uniref:Ig-like domain-containing protein n=1 Tax=Sporosarcina sp. FSL K6-5500 TaxID=2921558 RepID=UPI0030F53D5C
MTSVSVTPGTANVVQGGTSQLSSTVAVVGGAAQTVNWSSGGTVYGVTVDTTGLVTVASFTPPGNYTITATSTFDSTKTATATITVN